MKSNTEHHFLYLPLRMMIVTFLIAFTCNNARAAEAYPEYLQYMSPKVDHAVEKGLRYLARNQLRNGSWSNSYQPYPCTMTALAGLALMSAGNTPSEGEYAENVNLAVHYLIRIARPSGLITAPGQEGRSMYGHGFAMLFLAQAYGMETNKTRQEQIRRVLERAIRLTEKAQSKAGGWYYSPDSNSDEGSVTVTQIQALRACRDAGLKVSKKTIDRACNYIHKCANKDGGISYSLSSRGRSLPAITAAAVATMYSAGEYEHPVAVGALKYTRNQLKKSHGKLNGAFGGHAFYGRLYLSQTMWFAGGKDWDLYFPKDRDTLLNTQTASGSWQGGGVGEIFATAVAIITLQLPNEQLPFLTR